MTMCEARGLDHLALAPRLECSGFFEKAVELYFIIMLCIASQPWLVRTGWRMSYVGVGAFNLVRHRATRNAADTPPSASTCSTT